MEQDEQCTKHLYTRCGIISPDDADHPFMAIFDVLNGYNIRGVYIPLSDTVGRNPLRAEPAFLQALWLSSVFRVRFGTLPAMTSDTFRNLHRNVIQRLVAAYASRDQDNEILRVGGSCA